MAGLAREPCTRPWTAIPSPRSTARSPHGPSGRSARSLATVASKTASGRLSSTRSMAASPARKASTRCGRATASPARWSCRTAPTQPGPHGAAAPPGSATASARSAPTPWALERRVTVTSRRRSRAWTSARWTARSPIGRTGTAATRHAGAARCAGSARSCSSRALAARPARTSSCRQPDAVLSLAAPRTARSPTGRSGRCALPAAARGSGSGAVRCSSRVTSMAQGATSIFPRLAGATSLPARRTTASGASGKLGADALPSATVGSRAATGTSSRCRRTAVRCARSRTRPRFAPVTWSLATSPRARMACGLTGQPGRLARPPAAAARPCACGRSPTWPTSAGSP
mmetsp:Transcript_95500/g.294606  ORF Transcript_95500/g.294606 Transcript_95500/m.294606 type:complete len:345 (+) Transcript_95500:2613-3647(+)